MVLTVNRYRHTGSTFGLIWNQVFFFASAGGQRKKLTGQSTDIHHCETVVASRS